jgi:hypothetical protein
MVFSYLCFLLTIGPLPWISYWIRVLFPLLSLAALWRYTRLPVSEEIVQRPFYSRGSVCVLHVVNLKTFCRFNLVIFWCYTHKCCKVLSILNFNRSIYVFLLAGFQFDYVFDWTILKYQQSQMTSAPPRAMVSAFELSPLSSVLAYMGVYVWPFGNFLSC